MAQHVSAEKRYRQTLRRTVVNRARMGKVRTSVKAVETAIITKDKTTAQAALRAAQPIIMRAVSKGVLNKAAASRKVSRLSARIKLMNAAT